MIAAAAADVEEPLPGPGCGQIEDEALDPSVEIAAGRRRLPVVMDGCLLPSAMVVLSPVQPPIAGISFMHFLIWPSSQDSRCCSRFPGDRPPDQLPDLFVAATPPQGAFEVHFVVRQQAGPEVPVRRQAETVAGMTEMAAHRADETDLPRSSGQAVDPRRSVSSRFLCR